MKKELLNKLIKMAGFLDSVGLFDEASAIDSLTAMASEDKWPFRLIVTDPKDKTESVKPPADLRDVKDTEAWRQANIQRIKEEAASPNLTDLDRESLYDDLKSFISATTEELIESMREEEMLSSGLQAFRALGPMLSKEKQVEAGTFEGPLAQAFEGALDELIRAYGEDLLSIHGYDVQERRDNEGDEKVLEEIRLDHPGYFEALSQMVEEDSIDLISALSLLMKNSGISPISGGRGVDTDFWEWKEILMPLTERNLVQARWVLEKADNKMLKAELQEYLDEITDRP